LTYVGVMLSRGSSGVRVLVSGLDVNGMVEFLRDVSQKQFPPSVYQAADIACSLSSEVMLSLDIGETAAKRVGFELFFDRVGVGYPELRKILDVLIEKRLCTSEKRDGLLAWPGQSDPRNSKAPWPGHLIVESLLRPVDEFSIIDRRIHHLKLVWKGDETMRAKAYFGFEHRFTRFS